MVDTRTGKLTVALEENNCFDGEVYADEIEIPEKLDFREDQRCKPNRYFIYVSSY
jgi:WD repeat-containing protein 48